MVLFQKVVGYRLMRWFVIDDAIQDVLFLITKACNEENKIAPDHKWRTIRILFFSHLFYNPVLIWIYVLQIIWLFTCIILAH